MIAALGQENIADELVVRRVRAERFPQPLVEHVNALDPHAVRVRAKEVGPLVRPVIGVTGVLKEVLDPFAALAWIGVGEKSAGLFDRRKHTDGVEGGAAEKFRIRAKFGREKTKLSEVGDGSPIDKIVSGQTRVPFGRN